MIEGLPQPDHIFKLMTKPQTVIQFKIALINITRSASDLLFYMAIALTI